MIQKINRFLIKILSKCEGKTIPVFHPYNNIKICWDMAHFFFILILLFWIPIEICFKSEINFSFKIFTVVFFLCDILISLNTSYFDKGLIVNERKRIIHNYFETAFVLDVSTVIFYLINFGGYYAFFEMIFFLRWKKIEKIRLKVQEKFKIGMNLHSSLIEIMNLLFFSFYILNIFACIWFYIGSQETSPTWLIEKNLQDESLTAKYFYSFYWSTVTIMTVGYGDITASNLNEVIFTIFTIFFGCALFAYFINAVGEIVKDIKNESLILR